MSANFLLLNTGDYCSHFDYLYEISQWTATAGYTGDRIIYLGDTDHPSCMKIGPDANMDGEGIYYEMTVNASTEYALEFAYINTGTQEIDVDIYDQTGTASIYTETLTKTAWSNFYKEFTTPVGCVLLRIYLKVGTNGTDYFLIDDVTCYGNALQYDPDDYEISYESIDNTHTTPNGNRVIDETALLPRASLSFNHLTSAQFTRLLQLKKAKSPTWFSDQNVPQMVEEYTIYTETEYTFSGITNPTATHEAYYTTSSSLPSAAGDFETTEISTVGYQAIDGDDSNYYETAITTTRNYGYHKFNFKVTEYSTIEQIRSFSLTYKGLGSDAATKNADGVVLYLWNGNKWIEIDKSTTPDKETLSFSTTKPEQAQDFVDLTNGWIRVLVRTQGHKSSSGALALDSYYVSVTVNKDLATTIPLKNKAVLTAGDVVSVENITDGTTLVLTTDYLIGDDRQSVIVSGEDDGDLIRITYNQYYHVRLSNMSERRMNTATPTTPPRQCSVTLECITGID